MADTRQSLFGPSPEEVAMMQSQQGQQDAMGWAQLPAGRGAVAAGAMAGQALGGIAGRVLGGQDPMQAKAQKLQAAQQEAEAQAQSMGIDLASNPKDYYKVAAQTLQKYGLIDEAQNVMNISQNHDLAEREMKYKESSVKASDKFGMSGNIIYNKTTGETNPVKGYVGKNTEKDSPLAIAKKDYEEGKLTKEEYDAVKAKITNISGDKLDRIGAAIQASANGTLAAIRADKQQQQSGKNNADFEKTIYDGAESAISVNHDIENIRASLETGNTNFGSFAEGRRATASFFQTFMPSVSKDVNQAFGIDVASYDNVERSSKTILAELAKRYSGGSRMTAAALQTLEKAGPAVWLTNEGLDTVGKFLEKQNQYAIDQAHYLATLPEGTNYQREMFKWREQNANSEKYFMTPKDLQEVKQLSSKNKRIKELMSNSAPLPISSNGTVDPKLVTSNRIYTYGGKFYKTVPGVGMKEIPL